MVFAVLSLILSAAVVTGTAGTAVVAVEEPQRPMKNLGRITQEELEKRIPLGLPMADVEARLGSREEESDRTLEDGRVQWFWELLGGDKNVRVFFRDGKVVERVAGWHGKHWQ